MAELSADASTVGAIYNDFGDYYHESRKDDAGRFTNEYIDRPTLISLLNRDLNGLRVLDAGCGSGIVSELLASNGAVVMGIDASSKMIDIAQAQKPVDADIAYAVGDVAKLAFDDRSFDLIVL